MPLQNVICYTIIIFKKYFLYICFAILLLDLISSSCSTPWNNFHEYITIYFKYLIDFAMYM
jgi:hypothetical protein